MSGSNAIFRLQHSCFFWLSIFLFLMEILNEASKSFREWRQEFWRNPNSCNFELLFTKNQSWWTAMNPSHILKHVQVKYWISMKHDYKHPHFPSLLLRFPSYFLLFCTLFHSFIIINIIIKQWLVSGYSALLHIKRISITEWFCLLWKILRIAIVVKEIFHLSLFCALFLSSVFCFVSSSLLS